MSRAVSPASERISMAAPACTRSCTVLCSLCHTASIRAVFPASSCRSGFAPAFSNMDTINEYRHEVAQIRAVAPREFGAPLSSMYIRASICARACSSVETASACPSQLAFMRGVCPRQHRYSMSTFLLIKLVNTKLCPFRLASDIGCRTRAGTISFGVITKAAEVSSPSTTSACPFWDAQPSAVSCAPISPVLFGSAPLCMSSRTTAA
mmetsp:Transcript_111824/g.154417  ORF Transcript_111824/g.154417 Transcript_111824/m.154417 type:complete len:208 (-) Transcript_111824:35-658(-)